MTSNVDILVIGGGIAGLSAAARLARHATVAVLEREEAVGYHASGRSATFLHLGIGTGLVRALTASSRAFFVNPPDGFAPVPLAEPRPAMFIARHEEEGALAALEAEMRGVSDCIERVDAAGMLAQVPVLQTGPGHFTAAVIDHDACRLDSDALLQAHVRAVRRHGGRVVTGAEVRRIERRGTRWVVDTQGGSWSAATLVNAAGAWADRIAQLAGVQPLRLQPLRRTIIAFDPPDGVAIVDWPFVKTVDDGFYMLPDAGRVLASPMDVSPSEPVDARPEEIDIATAAWRVEQATRMEVRRTVARWAGLRSFLPDSNPAVGFDADAPGFFWLAGQGGYGLQTSPALSLAADALVRGADWPEPLAAAGIRCEQLDPARLRPRPPDDYSRTAAPGHL